MKPPTTKPKPAPPFYFDPTQRRKEDETLQARLRGLDNLDRAVAVRRNVQGVKNRGLRAQIEAAMRKHLDAVIALTTEARTALLAGDVTRYENKCKDARVEWLIALNELKNPFAKKAEERNAMNAVISKKGGDATAERYARPDLDDLIRGCIDRKETPPVIEWAQEYCLSRSAVYRRIVRIKQEK